MAYYLIFDGINDYVEFTKVLDGASIFEIEFDFMPRDLGGDNYDMILGSAGVSTTRNTIFTRTNGALEVAFVLGGTRRVVNTSAGLTDDVRSTIKVVYDGTTLSVQIDGVSVGSVSASGTVSSEGIKWIARYQGGQEAQFDLYGLKITDGTTSWFWNPSSSGGTGSTLPEDLQSNDGTLVDFPADDSQWVFYSTGPDTPVNPSITNLLATSARLNWEQG